MKLDQNELSHIILEVLGRESDWLNRNQITEGVIEIIKATIKDQVVSSLNSLVNNKRIEKDIDRCIQGNPCIYFRRPIERRILESES